MENTLHNGNHTLPMVSIVIPMFNELETIEKCIGSILRQDYPMANIEILVVDGGSKDGSREKVLELARTKVNFRLLENPGRITAKGLNIGIKNAQGDVVTIYLPMIPLLHTPSISAGQYLFL